MNKRRVCETKQGLQNPQEFYPSITSAFSSNQNFCTVADSSRMQLDGSERIILSINDLQIGRRIQNELRQQGRTVSFCCAFRFSSSTISFTMSKTCSSRTDSKMQNLESLLAV